MKKEVNSKKYVRIHKWLKKEYGKATHCDNPKCPGISKTFDWALKQDCGYNFIRENFIQLCRSCHAKYDIGPETLSKISTNVKIAMDNDEVRRKMKIRDDNRDITGQNNPMAGISVYELWVKKYGEEEANKRKEATRIKRSTSMKKRYEKSSG